MSTQRVQQFRTRQRTSKILLTIEVDEVLLVEALVEARLLYRHLSDDRRAITRALEKLSVRSKRYDDGQAEGPRDGERSGDPATAAMAE